MIAQEGYFINAQWHAYTCAVCGRMFSVLEVRYAKLDILAEHRMGHFDRE